jgi:hypothetical protein
MHSALGVLSSLCLLVACGAKTEGGGGAPSGVAQEEFVAKYVDAFCGTIGSCCSSAMVPFDRDACVAAEARDAQVKLDDTNALRKYDPAGAARCIDVTRSTFASCATSDRTTIEWTNVCERIYVGTVLLGGACRSERDCAPSDQGPVWCAVDQTAPPVPPMPICVVDPPGLAGEPCLGEGPRDTSVPFPHHTCTRGFYCDTTNRCVPKLKQGAACPLSWECEESLSCHNVVCEPLLDLGAPCDSDMQCSSTACDQQACATGVPLAPANCRFTP